MKKKEVIIFIVGLILILLLVGGTFFIRYSKNKENQALDEHLIQITGTEFKEKIENKESFIMIITATDCSHCEAYKPVLKKVLYDYDLTAYELDNKKLSNEELAYLKGIVTINGTPTTVFFKNGEETSAINRLIGEVSRSATIERLKNLGYIKE